MIAGKAGAYPSESLFRVGSGLDLKHYTRMERLSRVKHSSLLQNS